MTNEWWTSFLCGWGRGCEGLGFWTLDVADDSLESNKGWVIGLLGLVCGCGTIEKALDCGIPTAGTAHRGVELSTTIPSIRSA